MYEPFNTMGIPAPETNPTDPDVVLSVPIRPTKPIADEPVMMEIQCGTMNVYITKHQAMRFFNLV